jgi:hypothetical protein
MSDPSADGRHGGRELKIDVLEPSQSEEELARPRRMRLRDVVFFAFIAVFFAGTLLVVVMGIGSILASRSADLHDTFHVRALGTGFVARTYQRMADASHEIPSMLLAWISVAFSVLNLALAVFLLWLRPRDRTARLLSIGIIGTAAVFNLPTSTTIEILPLTTFESLIHGGAHIITGLAYTAALLLVPDGRPVPRWRAPALIALYAPIVALAAVMSLRAEGADRPGVVLVFFGLVIPVAGVIAQGYRFRTSDDPAEHQQARLLFWALLPAIGIGVWFLVTNGFQAFEAGLAGRHLPEPPVEVFRVFLPVFLLIPIGLFLGLVRYRLWDIDRVINRTLVYGLATGILLGAYLGIVVLLQRLLPFTRGSDIAVATSTLVVAAAFFPLRRRIQDFVDRRFYRHRYDAQKTIEQFTTRLRDQLELEALAYELRGVVARTMQPSEITLLVKNPEGRLEWQWTYRGRH